MARRILSMVLAVSAAFVAGWILLYPSRVDPKNIKYICWKAGLCRMNLDTATETMIGDPDREKIVIGKTKEQLGKTFGCLLTPADASPYLRSCHENSSSKNRSVVFIRQSSWMILFDHDKAADLVLIKGC
jgi:hypothetical protein